MNQTELRSLLITIPALVGGAWLVFFLGPQLWEFECPPGSNVFTCQWSLIEHEGARIIPGGLLLIFGLYGVLATLLRQRG